MPGSLRPEVLVGITRVFTAIEDFVYIGLGVLLAGGAVTLLTRSVIGFGHGLMSGRFSTIELVDRILLILLVVELLYTVQVSLREHTLVPEPFLLVGLISAIRRVLVLTAEVDTMLAQGSITPQQFAVELAVLAVLILALAVSLILLRRRRVTAAAVGAA
ncbi:MAG TPA: phosphate-starvation-inducible PsiE family protein [Methylomirabilota bacterium]|jgi:uncharacterized membrane protein (DUF373 family)